MSQELLPEKLYEIPSCTICLNQLTQDLSTLACGHVFHISCITQHFEYKGTCPNCQKKAQLKEIRSLVYPVVSNNKSTSYLQSLIESIGKSEGQQVQGLLQQIKKLSDKKESLENSLRESQKQNQKKSEQNEKIRGELTIRCMQHSKFKQQNSKLKEELSEQVMLNAKANSDLMQISRKYDQILRLRQQFEQFKAIQKSAAQNSEQLIKYRNELQIKKTPLQIVAKSYFQMLQLKNLNILRMKEKQKEYNEKYRLKEDQIFKLKNQIQQLKVDIEDQSKQVQKWKGKYQKLKDRYRELFEREKSKSRIQQNGDIADQNEENSHSLSFSMGLSNRVPFLNGISSGEKIEKNEKQGGLNLVQKTKPSQTKLVFGNQALKKQVDKKQMTLNIFIG